MSIAVIVTINMIVPTTILISKVIIHHFRGGGASTSIHDAGTSL